MFHGDFILYTFVFFIRVSLFVATGIVLHQTDGGPVLQACPILWESMATVLIMKCIRVTVCAIAIKLMHSTPNKRKGFEPLDLIIHIVFFVLECITTSRALNTPECIVAASKQSGGPLIAYVNGISCVWDGCYILACALYAVVNK